MICSKEDLRRKKQLEVTIGKLEKFIYSVKQKCPHRLCIHGDVWGADVPIDVIDLPRLIDYRNRVAGELAGLKKESGLTPERTDDSNYFTDLRDNQVYRTVKMPDGNTWFAQNMNFVVPGSRSSAAIPFFSEKQRGRQYTWEEAKAVCPQGWHLPTKYEWEALVSVCGGVDSAGKMLKSTKGWNENGNGDDSYDFSALPCGYVDTDEIFHENGCYGRWWTDSKFLNGSAHVYLAHCSGDFMSISHLNIEYATSVRYVKN
jgi:uncharacterized protein (TIGR02145 family)